MVADSDAGHVRLQSTDQQSCKFGMTRVQSRILFVTLATACCCCLVAARSVLTLRSQTPRSPPTGWKQGTLRSTHDRVDYQTWWTAYHDPTLDRLIDLAYQQNLSLLAAGTRVLEARAKLGVAIGEFYPQTQQIGANVSYNQASQVDPTSNPSHELGQLLARFARHADHMGAGSLGQVPSRGGIGGCRLSRVDCHL